MFTETQLPAFMIPEGAIRLLQVFFAILQKHTLRKNRKKDKLIEAGSPDLENLSMI